MSRDALILNRIFELTGSALEGASTPIPDVDRVIGSMEWSELLRVSAFWRDPAAGGMTLGDACGDLVTGLAHLGSPWSYWIRGSPTGVTVRFGAPSDAPGRGALGGLLAASFPDVRLAPRSTAVRHEGTALSNGIVLTGIPATKATPREGGGIGRIERVCRALRAHAWSYLVFAEPVPRAEVVARLNQLTGEIRTFRRTSLRRGTVDEDDRVAARYVELLEAQVKRYELARASGLWSAHAVLLTDDEAGLALGGAALLGSFAGEGSHPVPLRLLPASVRGGADAVRSEPLTSRELSTITAIPGESYQGYEVVAPARFSLRAPAVSPREPRVSLGEIVDRGTATGQRFEVPLRDLTKHVLVAGVTGSGKTNTAFRLIESLWIENQVPFLVIESAKSEYRSLLRLPAFQGMSVYTLGDETVAPFRLNPLEVPPGVLIQTHLDYVNALFAASFVLYPPMPYVLEQSLQEIFEDRGWDISANDNRRGADPERAFPTLSDLHRKVEAVVHRMGYDRRLAVDVTAGLQARINQLRTGGGKGRMLDTRRSVPLPDLFARPCVLELKQVVSDDEKAFLIGLLMIRLLEHLETHRGTPGDRPVGHVVLIEEAHRLLRSATDRAGEDAANPRARAVETFANILAEVRAYGEGVVIIEQIPTKLAADAVKSTNLKIVHRLVAKDDRDALGNAMRADPAQIGHLGLLSTGEAVVFAEGMSGPALVSMASPPPGRAADASVDDEDLRRAWRGSGAPPLTWALSACSTCPRSSSGSGCQTQPRGWHRLARPPFDAFHSALAHNHAYVRDAYDEVQLACRGGRGGALDPVCTLTAFLEEAIEERAAFESWPFSSVAELVEASVATVRAIGHPNAPADRKAVGRAIATVAARYRRTFETLAREDRSPFAACGLCEARCLFRPDGSPGTTDASERFQDEFARSGGNAAQLAALAWRFARLRVYRKDLVTRRALALCFAVQRSAELHMSATNQKALVGAIREELQQLVEGDHDAFG